MSGEAEIRIKARISTNELERRWKATRQVMKESGLDFLIMQNSTAHMDGYVRWFIDMPVGQGYPITVIFPRDDEMTTICHGPLPPAEPSPPAWALRGVRKRISVPNIPSLGYSSIYDAEKVVEELAEYKNCRIGLLGMGLMTAALYKYITEHLGAVEFVEVTDLVDNIKAIKSDEEINLIRETCAMQDATFEYISTRVQPGKREYEVYADIIHKCLELGGEQTNILIGSAPLGTTAGIHLPYFGNRLIEEGDQLTILIESSGPSGFWVELARIVCLGEVSPELEEQFRLAQKAQMVTLDLLKPGADPKAIWDAHNEFLRSKGYPEEKRTFAHGQGYDLVERPSLYPAETIKIQARMNIAVHPAVVSPKAFGFICDNYLVSETGENERLHKTPQRIFTA